MIRTRVWGENFHDRLNHICQRNYPTGMHNCIADALRSDEIEVSVSIFEDPEHGLSEENLNNTDVLIWWSHSRNEDVPDEVSQRVQRRVLDGMGFIALHSAHLAKPFRNLMGTGCGLTWREANEKERLWVVDPTHPIAEGIGRYFELEEEEMYGEHFDIPAPDELVFISWFEGGEVFRSGCTFKRGRGKIFYFRPGHEMYPTYHDKNVQRVISNAVKWAKPTSNERPNYWANVPPMEPLKKPITVFE
ncbi:ThuA domain-containing protein [Paenibacillus sacheonensis]|uniref:Trehalose utilization protein ThuA n=1 Tax=Paenibacillus sacheonensis TaxID=742054 RepID=A0A7X5BYX8_9BACL|nr:ThuA domain-containing protein [Paenibacillus sacheonensis]MBM7568378.1 trehalose utilization protein [Paenibacillus sacheonensis]NBC72078.1 trehalose utilization protein ThuA [Paenibacillus sacheonensis]